MMKNKRFIGNWKGFLFLALIVGFVGCKPSTTYKVSKIEGNRIPIDSSFDEKANSAAVELLAPYKSGIDSVMNQVIGYSKITLKKGRPESTLSNLVADVLREAAIDVLGKPADVGLVNMGGLRNILPEGDITTGTVFEILPFENSLCVSSIKGEHLFTLMENIAQVKGEGVSNVNLTISSSGELLSALVDGKPIDKDKMYTVATIDYLADGNDGMVALMQSEERSCPAGATLRGLFLDYVQKQTALGNPIHAVVEGRIVVK